jgi:hypothetical protein
MRLASATGSAAAGGAAAITCIALELVVRTATGALNARDFSLSSESGMAISLKVMGASRLELGPVGPGHARKGGLVGQHGRRAHVADPLGQLARVGILGIQGQDALDGEVAVGDVAGVGVDLEQLLEHREGLGHLAEIGEGGGQQIEGLDVPGLGSEARLQLGQRDLGVLALEVPAGHALGQLVVVGLVEDQALGDPQVLVDAPCDSSCSAARLELADAPPICRPAAAASASLMRVTTCSGLISTIWRQRRHRLLRAAGPLSAWRPGRTAGRRPRTARAACRRRPA